MSSELKFINTPELRFFHSKEGVTVIYKKRKFILGTLSVTELLTEEEALVMANINLISQCMVRGLPQHTYDQKSQKIIKAKDLTNDYSPFYKYISDNTFNKYVKNGIWQLGNIHQYRTIENSKQRDVFEGYSHLSFNINDKMVHSVCNTGFNYLIFCGTKSKESSFHKEQFGEKELYFPNVRSFAEAVKKTLNARKYFIQKVEYSTIKAYCKMETVINPSIQLEDGNILTSHYFDTLSDIMLYPSLFVKPDVFRDENEVRIVFEMPTDQKKPFRFKNKSLLDYIKY